MILHRVFPSLLPPLLLGHYYFGLSSQSHSQSQLFQILPLLALLSFLALFLNWTTHCRSSMFEVLDEDLLVCLLGAEKANGCGQVHRITYEK